MMTPSHKYLHDRRNDPIAQPEEIEGILLPVGIKASNVRELRQSMRTRPDDVFIVTYPKSGTTWVQQIVKLIRNNGIENGGDIDAVLPWIDVMTLDEVEAMSDPRGFKTHLPYTCIAGGDPAKQVAKYIYVYRNPKDVLVSYYHFYCTFLPCDVSWDVFFEHRDPEGIYGNLLDHVKGWYEHKDCHNIFIVSYEGLKRSPHTHVEQLASFLGCDLDDDAIGKVVEESSFSVMRDKPFSNNEWMSEYRREGTPFMRRGEIGDWKNLFTAEQSEKIDKLVEEKLGKTGLVYDYGDNLTN